MRPLFFLWLVAACVVGCDVGRDVDGGGRDASVDASAGRDARVVGDEGVGMEAGARDVGARADVGADAEAGPNDDAGADTGVGVDADHDAFLSIDAGHDAFLSIDAGHDAFVSVDGGRDAFVSSGGCVSGALGTRAVRFRWRGSSPGSTAYVDYELDQLPDTTRWHVSAANSSSSYTPIFDDTFLGEGGLDLEGTAFIDVELSTAGLGSVSRATIAIYGRSFDTTASGSFRWQTFHGTGAAPTNLVANSAPYTWYLADATEQLPAGDGATLLRIYPGPSSDALIVSRVEICFAD